jgi:hypothetical protein
MSNLIDVFVWRLYYYNGDVFSDKDGEPWESPTEGVVVVGQFEHVKANDNLNNALAYLHRSDLNCWLPVGDAEGLRDHLSLFVRHIDCVRYGLWWRRDEFRKQQLRARAEVDAMRRAAGLME